MGARHGAWCVGCCWALMASLFALGVMSLAWMAFVAALIALEKTVAAGGRAVTVATALILLVLGVAVIAAPGAVPGLTIPGGGMSVIRGVLLLAAAVAVAIALGGTERPGPRAPSANPLLVRLQVGENLAGLTAGTGDVWVNDFGREQLLRLSGRSGRVVARFPLGPADRARRRREQRVGPALGRSLLQDAQRAAVPDRPGDEPDHDAHPARSRADLLRRALGERRHVGVGTAPRRPHRAARRASSCRGTTSATRPGS